MIKINLASKKQAVLTSEVSKGSGKAGLGGLDKFTDQLKEMDLRKWVLSIVVGVVATYTLQGYESDALKELDDASAKLFAEQVKIKTEIGKTKGYEDQKKALEADELMIRTKVDTVQKLILDRQLSPKILLAISSGIPSDVWLNEVVIGEEELHLKGSSLGYNQISDFMKSLNETALLSDVRLVTTEQQKDVAGLEVASFEVVAKKR